MARACVRRLDAAALPIRKAVEFGIQIAEGVAAAHEKGILHRDLKPENVFVTRDERLKILDFGLAKLVDVDAVTLTAPPQTSTGAVLGTVGYLSPEQASGLPADQRSDIFSVGAVLFEMVTHRRAFARATPAQTLAAVLEDDPTASASAGSGTTARLMNLVRRCLEKSPERRFQSARDLSFALSEALHDGVHSSVDRARRSSRTVIAAVASALVVGAVSGWIGSRLRPGPAISSPLPSVAFSLTLPRGETFVIGNPVALSPDGQQIVYGAIRNGQANLYLRKLSQLDPVLLPETSGAHQPIFSPDGESIAFVADGALKVLRFSGGSPTRIASVNNLRGASWGDDDWIVYAPDVVGGLFRVSSRGGAPEQLTEVDKTTGGSSHRFPHVLPGAGALVFVISDGQQATISALDLRSRRRVDGLATGHGPQYLPSGHLAFVNRNGQLSLLPFDASNLRALGPATTLQEPVRLGFAGEFQGAAASSGTLAFVPDALPLRSFVAIDRDGKERPLAIEPRPIPYLSGLP